MFIEDVVSLQNGVKMEKSHQPRMWERIVGLEFSSDSENIVFSETKVCRQEERKKRKSSSNRDVTVMAGMMCKMKEVKRNEGKPCEVLRQGGGVWEVAATRLHDHFSDLQKRHMRAPRANLLPSERLLAFLDDIFVVKSSERVSDVHASPQHELWRHSRIEVHQGKTQLWNTDGVMPSGCEAMTIAARAQDENASVWREDHALPPVQQGVKLLGTHVAYVEDQVAKLSLSHSVSFERIQAVTDLQVAWLLLVFCAASRANYYFRVVVRTFAERHDAAVWRCLQGMLGTEGDGTTLDLAQLPFHWGGLGLRSAVRSSGAAHWASWADSLPMIQKRQPAVARLIIVQLTDQSDGSHLSGATFSRERLLDVSFAVPTWVQIADGLRPG